MSATRVPAEGRYTLLTLQATFDSDVARFTATFKKAKAFVIEDGEIIGLNPDRLAPGVVDAWCALLSFGYANSLIPV